MVDQMVDEAYRTRVESFEPPTPDQPIDEGLGNAMEKAVQSVYDQVGMEIPRFEMTENGQLTKEGYGHLTSLGGFISEYSDTVPGLAEYQFDAEQAAASREVFADVVATVMDLAKDQDVIESMASTPPPAARESEPQPPSDGDIDMMMEGADARTGRGPGPDPGRGSADPGGGDSGDKPEG